MHGVGTYHAYFIQAVIDAGMCFLLLIPRLAPRFGTLVPVAAVAAVRCNLSHVCLNLYRFCSTRYQVCLYFQLELVSTSVCARPLAHTHDA